MNKRLIIVGPTASGKNILRERLAKKGYTFDVSYTTREIRKAVGEVDGHDYHFISLKEFEEMESNDGFYEKVYYNGNKYGTGRHEWDTRDVFIMEPDGVDCILEEDRNSCFIIFIEPSTDIRIERMKNERKWSDEQIQSRLTFDNKRFSTFDKYDIKITNSDF